jgi:hypothetical protein
MRISAAWTLAILSMALLLSAAASAQAQYGPSPYYPAPGGYPVQPAGYGMSPYGMPVADPYAGAPAELNGGGEAVDACPECGNCGGCGHCGLFGRGGGCGRGCGNGPLGMGLLNGLDVFDRENSFSGMSCCNPRWFDVAVDFMYIAREDVVKAPIDFTSRAGATVLSTNNLDFDYDPGFRVTLQLLAGPGTNLEATYFGTFHWSTSAQVNGPGNLNSIPFAGFAETSNSTQQSIGYGSELNSAELNLRRRWISPNCRVHTSLLMGARYVSLEENFRYITQNNTDSLNYLVSTSNDLIGFQLGGDLNVCVTPRFKFGGEFKAGIFGNDARQTTTINTTPALMNNLPDSTREFRSQNNVSFVGEAGGFMLYHVSPRCTIRGGYQVVLVEGVALAPNNFNSNPNFGNRPVTVHDGGQAFYHGATGGFELSW